MNKKTESNLSNQKVKNNINLMEEKLKEFELIYNLLSKKATKKQIQKLKSQFLKILN
jgi:hypothetical protein